MNLRNHKTSNPAFNDYFWENESPERKMTVRGIIIKALFCLIIIAGVSAGVWRLFDLGYDIMWFNYGGIIASLIISIIISYKKHLAPILVPLYAIAKGCFIGAFSAFIKSKYPELPFQAIGVTIVTFFTVLILYQTRIIVVTKKLRSIIITACASIFVIYLISWILSLFGISNFIWGTSWVAIVFNVIAAIVASMTLLLDFDYIEQKKDKAPKSMEWFATWGLLVSLVWLYVEVLRLMRSLSVKI